MKSWITNSGPIFFAFGASLPFAIIYNRITVAILLVYTCFIFFRNRTAWRDGNSDYQGPLFLISFFFIYFVTDLLATPSDPWQVTDTYFLFLVLGAIGLLAIKSGTNINARDKFMTGFLVGNMIVCLSNLIRAFYRSMKITDEGLGFDSSVWGNTPIAESINNSGNYFFSEFYSWVLHPSYASLYLEVCLAYVLLLIMSKQIKLRLGVLIIGFIFLNLYLLSSRIAIAAVFVLLIYSAIYWSKSRKFLIAIILFAVIATGVSLLNPRTAELFSSSILVKNERLQSWHCATVILQEKWHLGVGVTNIKPEMEKQYRRLGYISNAERLHNAHNQFLETLLASGIVGLVLLLSILLVLWQKASRTSDYLLLVFLLCLTMHFLVESMLSRHEGIILFASLIAIGFRRKKM